MIIAAMHQRACKAFELPLQGREPLIETTGVMQVYVLKVGGMFVQEGENLRS